MINASPLLLPSIPHLSQPTFPPYRSLSATMSESTRISDLSSVHSAQRTLQSDYTYGAVGDQFALSSSDLLPRVALSDHLGYTPILPRTSSDASGLFSKRCETCNGSHDGSFGAGRFCSSRCARTVGGLAHRKKRLLERGMKARTAAENRAKSKKVHAIARDVVDSWRRQGKVSVAATKPIVDTFPAESPRSIMQIGALLNPVDD